jgi:SPP1 gp7 family putative phage head morphogenesis protein
LLSKATSKLINRTMDKDPARAIVLRTRFANDAKSRFTALKKAIHESIVVNDCFGLQQNVLSIFASPKLDAAKPKEFQFLSDDKKMEAFNFWLASQIDKGILEVKQDGPWTNYYIKEGYDKGRSNALSDLSKYTGNNVFKDTVVGLGGRVNTDILKTLYTRAFDQLKGVTQAMSVQIGRILSSGLLEGKTPSQIAFEINDRVDKIGIVRAKLIARTELQYAINFAILKEYERAEAILGEVVKGRWWTQQDERVRKRHRAWHGKVYTREQLMGMVGAINCRCSVLPYIESIERKSR